MSKKKKTVKEAAAKASKDEIPADVQGTSHAELFRTGDGPRPSSAVYIKIPVETPALGKRGVRTHRYTLMIHKREGEPDTIVLHDNLADPFQLENVAEEHPEVVRKLIEEELVPWLEKTGDPWLGS